MLVNKLMKIIICFIIAIALTGCAIQPQTTQTSQVDSANSIKIPKNFYAEELGQCRMNGYRSTEITATSYRSEIDPIIGFDWQTYHKKNGTSLDVNHKPLSKPMAYLSAASHHAALGRNEDEIQIVTDYIFQIAKNNQFMNTISLEEGWNTPCYAGSNNTSAPCPLHAPEWLGITMTSYIISAVWLKEYFTTEQIQLINPYIKKIYLKFIEPRARNNAQSFNGVANGGISRLAYAAWTNDKKLAEQEFSFRFKQINEDWLESGYIPGNSYRGVRGIFYHSLAIDMSLTYIQLAKNWDYPVPDKVYEKVKKSAELLNIGIENPEHFYNFPENKIPYFASKNPADTYGIDNQAIGLKELMKNVVGVDMKGDAEWERMARKEFTDIEAGFNPKCMFPN